MRKSLAGIAVAVLMATTAGAQLTPVGLGYEVRTFGGMYVPAETIENDLKAAEMFGAQVARELNDNVHVLGSFSFTHGHNKFTGIHEDRTFIYQYDLGIELNDAAEISTNWLFRPFVGVGAGARTYDFKSSSLGTNTCTAAYGSLGTEFQRRTVALRFETRNYVNCYKSPVSGDRKTVLDFGLSLGLVYHLR